jgi:hypothetical protein
MLLNYLSGLEEDCGDLSVNEVFSFAMKAACRCMNGKRAEILRIISVQREPKTITSIVDDVSRILRCPKSTVWANLNFLKEFGLIKNGRGKPVCLTRLGRLMLGKVLKTGAVNDEFILQADVPVCAEAEESHEEVFEEEVDI